MSSFLRLSRPALLGLATALEAGRVSTTFSRATLRPIVPEEVVSDLQRDLRAMAAKGMEPAHIAYTMRLLHEERAAAQAIADRVELVWSGTEVAPGGSRATMVVVQELFQSARRSVLIASFALDRGSKAEALFGGLAARMDTEPGLEVRLFVNVHRKHKDHTADAVLLRQFAETFRGEIWPGERLPEVFFDPRSLAIDGDKRACLHAKCIVIDQDRALVTSANFTEAAHERNIEAGMVIEDRVVARGLKAQFDSLVEHGALRRLPGL